MTEALPKWIGVARKQFPFREGPNNENPYSAFYGYPNARWCAFFVSWCCRKSRHPLPSMQSGMPDGYMSVFYGMQWAKANGFWRPSWKLSQAMRSCTAGMAPFRVGRHAHGSDCVLGKKGTTGHTIEGNRSDEIEHQTFTSVSQSSSARLLSRRSSGRRGSKSPQGRSAAKEPRSSDQFRTWGTDQTARAHRSGPSRPDHPAEKRTYRVKTASGERDRLAAAAAAIERVLAIKQT